MCTVTYLPFSNGDYLLTQNRDVGYHRQRALPPKEREYKGIKLIYPVDPQGGGTWNALSETHHACLLNGADYDYYPDFNAPKSRGSLCLDVLISGENFLREEDLRQYDDFTLLYFTRDQSEKILEFRWNGEELITEMKDPMKPQIWISRGLYSREDYYRKKRAFDIFLTGIPGEPIGETADKIWDFHQQEIVEEKEGFLIDRPPQVRTVSTFQTMIAEGKMQVNYKDQ